MTTQPAPTAPTQQFGTIDDLFALQAFLHSHYTREDITGVPRGGVRYLGWQEYKSPLLRGEYYLFSPVFHEVHIENLVNGTHHWVVQKDTHTKKAAEDTKKKKVLGSHDRFLLNRTGLFKHSYPLLSFKFEASPPLISLDRMYLEDIQDCGFALDVVHMLKALECLYTPLVSGLVEAEKDITLIRKAYGIMKSRF